MGGTGEDGKQHDGSLRRPADVYIPRWRRGIPAAIDFAVTSGLRADVLPASLNDAAAATRTYETHKRNYLNTADQCQTDGMHFLPFVVEAVGGGLGPEAHKTISEIAKVKAACSGDSEDVEAEHLHQSIGLVLHRDNALAILRRASPIPWQDASLLNALTTVAAAQPDND